MLTPEFAKAKFEQAQPYGAYLEHATPDQRDNFARTMAKVSLTSAQRELVQGFTRRLNVLAISGVWCGDCAAQCPMFEAIAAANRAAVHLRFLDRDANLDLAEQVRICGGLRVPTVLFLSEDFDFVGIAGDKSLSRLRAVAQRALGASCALPGAAVPADEIAAGLADWLDDFERAHLLVRLSSKLRQRHGD